MWNTSANGARPNLRTKETFSPFTNKGREQKAEGKLWQKTVPLTWAVNTEKHRGKFSHLQLGYDSYQLVEIPPVGTAYPSLEIKNLRSSQKEKKKKGIFNYLKRCLTQQGRVAPATLQQRGWVRAGAQAGVLCPPSALRERLLQFSQQSYFRNQLLSAQLTFSLMHFYTLSARMRRIFTFFNKPDSLKVIGDL